MANPTTVGRSVMIVENSATAQWKYLALLEGCTRACACERVRLEWNARRTHRTWMYIDSTAVHHSANRSEYLEVAPACMSAW